MGASLRPVFVVLIALAVLVGCKTTPTVETPTEGPTRVFYPPEPAAPRLQFLTSFSEAETVIGKAAQKSSFADFIAGKENKDEKVGRMSSPYGVAARDGVIYVCDVGRDVVHVYDLPRKQYRRLEAPHKLGNPVNIMIDKDNTKYVCDSRRMKIAVFNAQDQFVREIGSSEECVPLDVAIYGDELYVADVVGGEVEVWSKEGSVLRKISSKGESPDQLSNPTNLDIGADGLIFVSDSLQQTIKVFDQDGKFVNVIGRGGDTVGSFGRPKGVAIDPQGNVYVADAQFEVVQVFQKEGQLLLTFGGGGNVKHAMGMPAGVAVDASSVSAFRQHLDPAFNAEYVLLVVNQFGKHKIGVYGFGKSSKFDAAQYEVKPVKTE